MSDTLEAGGGAAAVLFESESVRGNTQTSKQKREELARAAGRGAKACGGDGSLNGWDVQSKRIFGEDGIAPTLNSGCREGGGIQPSVLQAVALQTGHTASEGQTTLCMASGQANSEITDDGTSPTITCLHEQPIVCMADDTQNAAVDKDVSGTLKVGGGGHPS